MVYSYNINSEIHLNRPLPLSETTTINDTSNNYFLSTDIGIPESLTPTPETVLPLNSNGYHAKLLLITQWICVLFFLIFLCITVSLFPPWKKEYHEKDFLQNIWAFVWVFLTVLRFFILALTTHIRRFRRPVPSFLIYAHRIIRCLAVLWFMNGFKPLFWDPPRNSYAVRLARSLWLLQAMCFMMPFIFYLLFCFCMPCLLILRHRMHSPPLNGSPTPEHIVSKLEVKKYQDFIKECRGELASPHNDTSGYNPLSAHEGCTSDTRVRKSSSILSNRVEGTCPICMIEFEATDEVMMMPCDKRHFFHVNCARVWLHGSQHCPICRANVVEKCNKRSGAAKSCQSQDVFESIP